MNVTGADQDRHLGRPGQLTGRYQRELIQQVARVLDDAGNQPCPAVGVPGAPDLDAIQRRDGAGHGHLPGAGRVAPGDQGEQRAAVGPGRILGPQPDGRSGATGEALILDHVRRPVLPLDPGDIGRQVRIGPGQGYQRAGGAVRAGVRVSRRGVGGNPRTPDGRRDRDRQQRHHQQLLTPLTAEQAPCPVDDRELRGTAPVVKLGLSRAFQSPATHRDARSLRRRPGRRPGVAGHAPVPQEHDPVRQRRQLRVVRDNHRCDPLPAGGPDSAHHHLPVSGIEGTRWLIRQEQPPPPDKRPGDRNPLPLAAGQLLRKMPGPIRQAHARQGPVGDGTGPAAADAVQLQREGHVLRRCQAGQQVEVLEDVANRPPPQPCPLGRRRPRHRTAIHQHLAGRRLLQRPGDRQQRALTRPAGPHHRHELPRLNREADIAQSGHLASSVVIHPRDMP